jgi:outer membrane murein-binding lipoprotein Lpp
MNTSAHNDPEYWGQEIAHLHASIDTFEARFEAECQILRCTVDTQIAELHAAVRRMENDIAAVRPDAYVQRIADQVAELKLKGDAAYELLQARLRKENARGGTTSKTISSADSPS